MPKNYHSCDLSAQPLSSFRSTSMSPVNRFFSPRGGANLWAQSDRNIEFWKRGAQLEVEPLTMEYAPILACDADCPLCPYKKSRDTLCKGLIPHSFFAAEDDVVTCCYRGNS